MSSNVSGSFDPDWQGESLDLSQITPDNLCSMGQRPYLMTGALVQTLRQHFSFSDNIEDPTLKDCVWSGLDGEGIVVESITRWLTTASGQRPAVVIKRNDYSVLSLGINDELMGWLDAEGNTYYAAYLRGSHTMFCLDNEAGGAERLAAEVYRELIQFGPELRRYLQLMKFKLSEVGQLHRLQEAMGGYAVPVSVAYAFEECWVLTPNAPRLKRIALSALIESSG